jgi:sulfite reductase (NADPH) flavoprotein alpha-component
LIEDYALSPAPDMLFELIGFLVGGERRKKARLLAKGGDPDGDAASFDVLAALETFGPIHPDPEGVPRMPRAAAAAALFDRLLAAGDAQARST